MKRSLGAVVQYALPQRLLGRIVYRAARARHPAIATPLKRWFAHHYRLDLGEAEHPHPDDYDCLNSLFTRALKPDARPVSDDPLQIVSPVDGTLTETGDLDGDTLLQAKGMPYTLPELLGETPGSLPEYTGGRYATIYLAPHDYHRVHAPLAATLRRTRYLPGRRFSVNRATAAAIPGLFCRNERVVLFLEGATGPFALVMVGALNVSSISTASLGEIASGAPSDWPEQPPRGFAVAEELGCFNLGSTVILVFPRGAASWNQGLHAGRTVRMAEPIGRCVPTDRAS